MSVPAVQMTVPAVARNAKAHGVCGAVGKIFKDRLLGVIPSQ